MFSQLLEKKKFSSRGRGITKTGIFGCHVETVERVFACQCSSPWNKRIGFMSTVCRDFGNIKLEILSNPGQVTVFLFWMNVLFCSAWGCMLVAPQRNTLLLESIFIIYCSVSYFIPHR